MGQNICSDTSSINAQSKLNYLDFQYGQDQKQGKVEHDNRIESRKNNQIQHILEDCCKKLKQSKLMYKDPTMPSDKLVLKSTPSPNNEKKQIQAIFLKPYKFLYNVQKGKPYKIFPSEDSNPDYILVKDEVMQFFGVFLCFLAKNRKIIDDIILTQSSSYGLLAVKMYIDGKQRIVYVDDYILCGQQRPVFSQPVKNIYMWPNILQKVWLKTNGFTDKIIQKSTPEQVFQSFLPYPYKRISLQQFEQQQTKIVLRKYLQKMNEQYGYVLTTKKDPKIHIGISGKKYLYLIGSFLYDKKRLYYIRNPCGKFSFRGQYDEINQEIRNKIKSQFGLLTVQQGNFLLQESQFIEQISTISICYYQKYLKSTSYPIQLENNNQIFIQTQLKNPGNLSLCFRQHSTKKSQSKFSPITYQILNINSSQIVPDQQNTEGCFGVHNAYLFPQVIKKLPQSKYLIRIKKKDRKHHYFGIQSVLLCCFQNQLKFDIKNQQQFSQLFKQFMKKEGKRNLKTNSNGISSKKNATNPIDHIVFMSGDLICIYIQYISPKDQQYKIQISFPELKNLQLIYPQIDLKQTSVLPNTLSTKNTDQIIIFQKIDLTAQTQLGQRLQVYRIILEYLSVNLQEQTLTKLKNDFQMKKSIQVGIEQIEKNFHHLFKIQKYYKTFNLIEIELKKKLKQKYQFKQIKLHYLNYDLAIFSIQHAYKLFLLLKFNQYLKIVQIYSIVSQQTNQYYVVYTLVLLFPFNIRNCPVQYVSIIKVSAQASSPSRSLVCPIMVSDIINNKEPMTPQRYIEIYFILNLIKDDAAIQHNINAYEGKSTLLGRISHNKQLFKRRNAKMNKLIIAANRFWCRKLALNELVRLKKDDIQKTCPHKKEKVPRQKNDLSSAIRSISPITHKVSAAGILLSHQVMKILLKISNMIGIGFRLMSFSF